MSYIDELRALEDADGMLMPERVVEFASNPDTALHSRFTWDDTEAAKAHRLWQARVLIRVVVREVPNTDTREPIRTYVSLGSDRKRDGGGYRTLVSVMEDDELRAELLAQAKAEARRWADRYRDLVELVKVREEIASLE